MNTPSPAPAVLRAADLIATGDCSPQCLHSQPAAPCRCRCGRLYHGALLAAEIPSRPTRGALATHHDTGETA